MDLQVRFRNHYFYTAPLETCTEIDYNIKHAEIQPELFGQHMREKQIHIKYQQQRTTAEKWTCDKATLRAALLTVYPTIRRNNTIRIWERTGYDLSAKEEKEMSIQLKEERQKVQKSIHRNAKQLLTNAKCSRLNKTFRACETETR